MIIGLNVINTPKNRPCGGPTLSRTDLKALASNILAASNMADAAKVVRAAAAKLPKGRGTWRFYMDRLANALEAGFPAFSVFTKGNSKLPFYAFSALPGFTCPGAGECLRWCYSYTGWRYPAAWARQVQNTMFIRHHKEVVAEAFRKLPEGGVTVRLYVDGDFDSLETVEFWMDLLARRPDIKAYGYSKSWRVLWEYSQKHAVPSNYVLNLSSGGQEQGVSREQMRTLPFVRGDFIALPINYKGRDGFARYSDPEYHRAVRKAAAERGLGKVFSCPGKCGECCGGNHACGMASLKTPIVIGIH